jgi:hypothetical protein
MPFEASRRHQYWTVDIRYPDMHRLSGGMIYVITILENFSRAILARPVSRTQDLTAYLMVLYAAIRLPLWELGDGEWLKVVRLRASRRRALCSHEHRQQALALQFERGVRER